MEGATPDIRRVVGGGVKIGGQSVILIAFVAFQAAEVERCAIRREDAHAQIRAVRYIEVFQPEDIRAICQLIDRRDARAILLHALEGAARDRDWLTDGACDEGKQRAERECGEGGRQ